MECRICGQFFTRCDNLKRHERNIHYSIKFIKADTSKSTSLNTWNMPNNSEIDDNEYINNQCKYTQGKVKTLKRISKNRSEEEESQSFKKPLLKKTKLVRRIKTQKHDKSNNFLNAESTSENETDGMPIGEEEAEEEGKDRANNEATFWRNHKDEDEEDNGCANNEAGYWRNHKNEDEEDDECTNNEAEYEDEYNQRWGTMYCFMKSIFDLGKNNKKKFFIVL